MEFMIYSKALFSTWIYYSPERVLFDVGEGLSANMGNKVFAIENVFITHGHADHIAGLWGLINSRNNAMGDKAKPLNVYYPEKSEVIREYLSFILKVNGDLKYELNFHPLKLGEKVKIRDDGSLKRYVLPFPVRHIPSEPSYGYHIVETRRKLKSEFKGLSQNEIIDLVRKHGREYITVEIEKKILTISGDGMAIDEDEARGTDLLLHECTFLDVRDRKGEIHAALNEVVELIKKANVKNVILYHISSRYDRSAHRIVEKVKEELKDVKIDYVHPGRIWIK